jgi:hypothetical protein
MCLERSWKTGFLVRGNGRHVVQLWHLYCLVDEVAEQPCELDACDYLVLRGLPGDGVGAEEEGDATSALAPIDVPGQIRVTAAVQLQFSSPHIV